MASGPRLRIGGAQGSLRPATRQRRVNRNPQHTFQIRQRPFEITPFLLAPVLPGETLRSFMWQMRTVTDPIKNPIIGWWSEQYFFYVKHRDLEDRDVFTSMMLDPSTDMSSVYQSGADTWTYTANGSVKWVQLCLERVVETWFREEGEAWDDYVVTASRPAAAINGENWTHSLVDRTTVLDPDDVQVVDEAGTDTIEASEIDAALRQWRLLRDYNLTEMSYEDYLAQYGVSTPAVELHIPELIRYGRDWSYPSNTIDPADGDPTSAVSWATRGRGDKNRRFNEPGFIFGVSVIRPKLYSSKQTGVAAGMMHDTYKWLPAILANDPATSLHEVAAGYGVLPGPSNNYVYDIKDILVHGDQFINFALSETDANLVGLPIDGLTNHKFPDSTMVDTLFVSASPANQVRSDGVVSMTVAGTQEDTSP